jgi:tetratricopeptide (TPR) repeat protein
MNRPFKIMLVLLSGSAFASAQASAPDLSEALRLLEEGRTTLAEPALSQAWDYLAKLKGKEKEKNSANAVVLYDLARVDYYRCNGAVRRGDKKAASVVVERAIKEAQQAVQLDDLSADAHSLLASLYGRKIGLGGVMAGPRLGPKAAAENKRAVELDANNGRVQAALGRQYLMSPKMFGGDVDKAIASFQKSIELEPASDETYIWLALAYQAG